MWRSGLVSLRRNAGGVSRFKHVVIAYETLIHRMPDGEVVEEVCRASSAPLARRLRVCILLQVPMAACNYRKCAQTKISLRWGAR